MGIVIDRDDSGILVESMNYRGRFVVSRDVIDDTPKCFIP